MNLAFLPETASLQAGELNWIFLGLLGTAAFILTLVFGLMLVFCVRYRRGSLADRGHRSQRSWTFEVSWTFATFVLFIALFFWGASLYVRERRPPQQALEIQVVAKQWMWKLQHPGGQREIDELHIPVGAPVKLVMVSQDVIHDFFVPAFRVKHDVLPGTYETMWFTPTKVGTYHLFCDEFCGTQHSEMGGTVFVMEPQAYAEWLAAQSPSESIVAQGAALFRQYGCSGCHGASSTVHAPPLEGLYGHPAPLDDGTVVMADEMYLRDSILLPNKQIAAGYPAIMPSFAGQISEEDLLKIIAYLKSLGSLTAERNPQAVNDAPKSAP